MHPPEMEHPGQSGRTLETGAAGVNLQCNYYLKNSRFFHKYQAVSRLNLQALIGSALFDLEAA
jgi:hypothetical protein